MDSDDLSDLSDLSQKGLREESHDHVDQIHNEYERRIEAYRTYFRVVCSIDKCLELWHTLWISGGFRRFTEIVPVAKKIGIKSEGTVSNHLYKLRAKKLAVVRSDGLYQMIGPEKRET